MLDFSTPAERAAREPVVYSVSDINEQVRQQLKANFSRIQVSGEITDLARPASGHLYFSLKDSQASLNAVMWRSNAARLAVPLQDGMEVICCGDLDVYQRQGKYQLVVQSADPLGEGRLQLELRALRERLAREGLFDAETKRPLPSFPRSVAVVTSPTGAAVRDFLEVARRRWRDVRIIVFPTAVQGAAAVPQIRQALRDVERMTPPPDVVVVTRGGGSLEDLWAFNDESLVRHLHACPIPSVSAIGHEIDVTLCDLVADVRALTPSEAAERVLPDHQAWQRNIDQRARHLTDGLRSLLRQAEQRLRYCTNHPALADPMQRIRERQRWIDDLAVRQQNAMGFHLRSAQQEVTRLTERLGALSPLAVLERGYAVVTRHDDRQIVRHAEQVAEGDQIEVRLHQGMLHARIILPCPLLLDLERHRMQEKPNGQEKANE